MASNFFGLGVATPTPGAGGSPKRKPTSPPDASVLNGTGSIIKPSKLSKLGGIGNSDDIHDTNIDILSPPPSPTQLSIKDQILKAITGTEFLDKLSTLVATSVEIAVAPLEPKIQVLDVKVENLIASVEILQSEINTLKSHPHGSHKLTGILTTLTNDVKQLQEQMSKKDDLIQTLNKRVENLEAYSRRNAVRITNIPTSETTGTDPEWMIGFAEKHLGVKLHLSEIGRMHRTGPTKVGKPRDILVKFTRYLSRAKIYYKKTFLTSKLNPERRPGVFINEHLTQQRATLFYLARTGVKENKITAAWTHDGSVITKLEPGEKTPIKRWQHNKELSHYLHGLPTLPPTVATVDDTDTTAPMSVG